MHVSTWKQVLESHGAYPQESVDVCSHMHCSSALGSVLIQEGSFSSEHPLPSNSGSQEEFPIDCTVLEAIEIREGSIRPKVHARMRRGSIACFHLSGQSGRS